MTVSDELPPRGDISAAGLDRVSKRITRHGCHLHRHDLRRVVALALEGMDQVSYTAELRGGPETEVSTQTVLRDSLEDVLNEADAQALDWHAHLDSLVATGTSTDGRAVELQIAEQRGVMVVIKTTKQDRDWMVGRFSFLRDELRRTQPRLRIMIPGPCWLQSAAGALLGGGAATSLLAEHLQPLAFTLAIITGCIFGGLAGRISASRYRTIIELKDKNITKPWLRLSFAETLLVAIGLATLVSTFVLAAPAPQTTAPTITHASTTKH